MVKVSLLRPAALAAMAFAGVLAAPVQAQTQDVDRINARSEARAARQEARAARVEARTEQRAERAAAPMAPEARVEARAERRAERMEARQSAGTGRNAPEDGWRSQRSGDGQRFGRRWDRGSDGSAATPSTPTRGGDVNRTWSRNDDASDWRRNGTYTDPARNRTYRDGRRGDSWRDRDERRDGYRNDTWRDRSSGYYTGSRDYRRWDRNDWRRDRRYDWSAIAATIAACSRSAVTTRPIATTAIAARSSGCSSTTGSTATATGSTTRGSTACPRSTDPIAGFATTTTCCWSTSTPARSST